MGVVQAAASTTFYIRTESKLPSMVTNAIRAAGKNGSTRDDMLECLFEKNSELVIRTLEFLDRRLSLLANLRCGLKAQLCTKSCVILNLQFFHLLLGN